MKDGDDPAIVAKAIVAAATDRKPKLRYTAGPAAGRAQHAAPHRPRPGLRQADPQVQPAGQLTPPTNHTNQTPTFVPAERNSPRLQTIRRNP